MEELLGSCGRCGSRNTRRKRATGLTALLALVLRQHLLYCGRCGWTGRAAPIRPTRNHSRRSRVESHPRVAPLGEAPDLEAVDRDLADRRTGKTGAGGV